MPKQIEFFYDVSSPWTYLAFVNVQALAKEEGAEIVWRPFLVGGVFNTVNPTMYRMRENPVPARDAWVKQDLQAWARLAGLKITFPPAVFPVNSVKALRGLLWAKEQGKKLSSRPLSSSCTGRKTKTSRRMMWWRKPRAAHRLILCCWRRRSPNPA
jgi:2-hydroxychromene-2-carboxylate isomerase